LSGEIRDELARCKKEAITYTLVKIEKFNNDEGLRYIFVDEKTKLPCIIMSYSPFGEWLLNHKIKLKARVKIKKSLAEVVEYGELL
jgi:hypothetical protein